jgi:hypothetical protein
MDSTVRLLVVISLFAALCATFAFVLDQQFVAAVFAAQFAFALTEAIRRARWPTGWGEPDDHEAAREKLVPTTKPAVEAMS